MRLVTAARIRRAGFIFALASLGNASWIDGWQAPFLAGLLVLGVGVGLWDMGGGG